MAQGQSNVYAKHLSQGEHSRDFTVLLDPGVGWLVRDERDAQPVRTKTYDDWHRVELAITRFALEAARLKREGWLEG
jgi:hypothetical protein